MAGWTGSGGGIDWRAGEIAVTGKGGRTERLPLPAQAGEALAAWLKDGRPACDSRAVFVTIRRPCRQLTADAVRQVMLRACDRAGLERRGAHRLRHSLATEMLRAGASLPEVGQVLRHRSMLSTAIYAKGRPGVAAPAGAALARERGMSGLRARAGEYLAMRRALGFKLESQGPRLMSFVGFCEARGAATVTTDLAVERATTTSRGSGHEACQARRLDVVRIFARHLQPLDPAAEIPPGDVLDRRQCRIPPYLYTPQEVTALVSAARTLRPAFRAVTWRTLIGLLAVTGMRQGEACRLGRDDVDLDEETITIEDSKFGKSRMVFLHPTAAAALRAYERARDEAFPEQEASTFFVNSLGRPLDSRNTPKTFAELAATAGVKAPPGQRAPRPHDLRHVFTVATLLDWYRDGGNVQARLPALSAWLGHVGPKSTYWYLSAVPELLALAAGRLEAAGQEAREAS